MRAKPISIAMVLFAAASAPAAYAASDAAQATMLIARVEVLSQQLASASGDAAGGNTDAFASLKRTRDAIAGHMNRLHSLTSGGTMKNAADLDAAWLQISADVGKVLEDQEQVTAMNMAASDINAKMPVLNSRMDEVVKILVERADSAGQVMIASRQMLLSDRMLRRMQSILGGGDEAESAAMGLQRDAQFYGVVLEGLIKGNKDLELKPIGNASVRSILTDINRQWIDLSSTVSQFLAGAADVQKARQAAEKTAGDVVILLAKADALMSRVNED
jgi:twitching motility protein PilJ